MKPPDLIIATTLLIVGALLLGGLLTLFFSQFAAGLRNGRVSFRLRKALQRLARADQLLDTEDHPAALAELRRAFVFEIPNSRPMINSLREHHQNILSRCLIVAEALGGRIANIADTERLILERAEIQILHLKALQAFRKLRHQRESIGKDLPAWSKSDFKRRLGDIRKELETNTRDLERAVDKLFASIKSQSTESITYH